MDFSSQAFDEHLQGHPRVHENGRENYERNIKSSNWYSHSSRPSEFKSDAPRVHEDGRENYERTVKPSNWFTHDTTLPTFKPEAARVHEDGRENYERSIKPSGWYTDNSLSNEYKPDVRLRSDTARDIAVKNRGCMQDNLQGYADPPVVKSIHPRGIKPEARRIAEVNKGLELKCLLDNYGKLANEPRPGPKVYGSEAEEYKEREHGSTKFLLNHFSTDPIPVSEMPPPHRLRLGGEEIAEKHKGEQMGPIMRLEGKRTPKEPKISRLHQESTGSGWDEAPPHHRIRPEAEQIAQKNSADSINEIILQNGFTPPQRKAAKILKHLTESPTTRKTPPHRVRLDGVEIMEKAMNQTEMSAIMHGCPKSLLLSGQKVVPHLQKSQLW
ncbi:unnamed protein product [Candidula unifasciata]|uniref:Uncharacterized protein n=1 Tax=Candidula unifasciata TaxID=100452 RepID=A0A8S3Z2Y8_9EUPU|nr:unnamed protein product [Candidula unifasciata]